MSKPLYVKVVFAEKVYQGMSHYSYKTIDKTLKPGDQVVVQARDTITLACVATIPTEVYDPVATKFVLTKIDVKYLVATIKKELAE